MAPLCLSRWWHRCLLALWAGCLFGLGAEEGGATRRHLVAALPADFAPTCFNQGGKATGFAVDVLDQVAQRAGVDISYVFGRPWDEIQQMLLDRRVDLVAVLVITPERQQRFVFTRAIETVTINAVVRSESTSITGLQAGQRVGLIGGSTADELLGKRTDLEFTRFGSQQQLLMELLAGRLDVIVTPRSNIFKLACDTGLEDRIRVLQPPLKESVRAMAFRPEDAALCQRMDAALADVLTTPEFNAAYQRWWGKGSSWWTAGRVAMVMGLLLVAVIAGLLVWRFRSLRSANAALTASEHLLTQSQRVAQLGHYILDTATGHWTSSPTLDRIFGIEAAFEHSVASWGGLIHPEDRAGMEAYLREEVLGRHQPFDREYRIVRHNDGAVRWVHGQGELEIVQGRAVRMFGIIQDITERRQAEEEAREASLRFETIFQGARDAMFAADPHSGRIIEMNRQAEALVGRTRAQLIGLHQASLHPEDLRDKLAHTFQHHAEGGGSFVETEVLHHDGSRIPVEISSSLIPVAGGGSLLLGTFRDIRERVRLQEQLQQSEKMTAIGQLAGGVAHDFNNQLAGITGYAELLSARLEDEQQKRWAGGILSAAQRAADLTRQLLAFARKGQSLRTLTDLHRTIGEVAELLGRSIDRRIAIDCRLEASPSLTLGDPGQLHHALLNLGLNARDAMCGGGRLVFSTRNVHLDEDSAGFGNAAGPFIEISVADTGSGMTPEVRRHLFEPFFTTKERGKGTGLGLAAVYGVVRNHGGVIIVESELGCGSCFILYLPQRDGEPTASSSSAQVAVAAPQRQRRILVVDDEPVVREMTREMLVEGGYTVEMCTGGREAVERCARAGSPVPDLVILDLVMPEQGGSETFFALRARHPDLRVLIASGHSINGEAQDLLDHGACGFLQKPFRFKELHQTVEQVFA